MAKQMFGWKCGAILLEDEDDIFDMHRMLKFAADHPEIAPVGASELAEELLEEHPLER